MWMLIDRLKYLMNVISKCVTTIHEQEPKWMNDDSKIKIEIKTIHIKSML